MSVHAELENVKKDCLKAVMAVLEDNLEVVDNMAVLVSNIDDDIKDIISTLERIDLNVPNKRK